MATSEESPESISLNNRKRTPDHPPYSEMIRAAITALNENDGSREAAISKYIASSYSNLPEGHPNLLAYHIRKLTRLGEFVMGKNDTFMNPNPKAASMILSDEQQPMLAGANTISKPKRFLDGWKQHKQRTKPERKAKPAGVDSEIVSPHKWLMESSVIADADTKLLSDPILAAPPPQPVLTTADTISPPKPTPTPLGRKLVLVRGKTILLVMFVKDEPDAVSPPQPTLSRTDTMTLDAVALPERRGRPRKHPLPEPEPEPDSTVPSLEQKKGAVRAVPTRRSFRLAEIDSQAVNSDRVSSE